MNLPFGKKLRMCRIKLNDISQCHPRILNFKNPNFKTDQISLIQYDYLFLVGRHSGRSN
jgi:hypothetical protein